MRIYLVSKKVFTIRGFARKYRWQVRATNGKIIHASTQSYYNSKDCMQNLRSLSRVATDETIPVHIVRDGKEENA